MSNSCRRHRRTPGDRRGTSRWSVRTRALPPPSGPAARLIGRSTRRLEPSLGRPRGRRGPPPGGVNERPGQPLRPPTRWHMNIKAETCGRAVIFNCRGELSADSLEVFSREINRHLSGGDAKRDGLRAAGAGNVTDLIFNLAEVPFIDSAGPGVPAGPPGPACRAARAGQADQPGRERGQDPRDHPPERQLRDLPGRDRGRQGGISRPVALRSHAPD